MPKLSVVFPAYQESANTFFWNSIQNLRQIREAEIVVVDGGSTDETLDRLTADGIQPITLPESSRALRLAKGIEHACGEWTVLNHPRSEIDPEGLQFVAENGLSRNWGAFTHAFDETSLGLRFTSWYSNQIRLRWRGIAYLDHGIIARTDSIKQIQIPDVDIFEDTYISRLLQRFGTPQRVPFVSKTSAVRFRVNGFWRQSILNQRLKLQFLLGVDHKRMNAKYEKGLDLNRGNKAD